MLIHPNLSDLLFDLPRVVTAQEMAAVDEFTIKTLDLPGRVLMENAGREAFAIIRAKWQPLGGKSAAVFCGKGNNGGDGFVVARLLGEAGVACEIFLLGKSEEVRGDALANYQILEKLGHAVISLPPAGELPDLSQKDFIVDALLGTGVRGTLQGQLAEVINHLNASRKPVVAIDLPTGMDTNSGAVEGPCVRATITVTFGAHKMGLLFSPAREFAGEVHVADIGFPELSYQNAAGPSYLLQGASMANWLPQRPPDAFKNRVGQVLVIAGARGFGGAARLAATAALRAGAGLVVLAAPASLIPSLEAAVSEVIKLPVPEDQGGGIALGTFKALQDRLAWADVVALGPGLGTSPAVGELVGQILENFKGTVVLDADGLNVLSGDLQALRQSTSRIILTPHPGELKRLVAGDQTLLAGAPVEKARRVAEELGHILVLKGAPTIVALPSEEILINTTGNAGMATAGSGDVLTGLIAVWPDRDSHRPWPRASACICTDWPAIWREIS
jgi:NAD(P)H-hydrate epimerase